MHRPGAVEDAHDDFLAVDRWQCRDAQIDHAHRRLHRDASILRPAALGDVEFGHDLQTRYQRLMELVRYLDLVGEHAIDAVAHDDALGPGLDVNIGGTQADGFENDRVGQSNRRWRFGVAQQILEAGIVAVLDDDFDAFVRVWGTDQCFQFLEIERFILAVNFVDLASNGSDVGGDSVDVETGSETDFLDQAFVERVGHGQQQAPALQFQRYHQLPVAETVRNQLGQGLVDLELGELHLIDQHLAFQQLPDTAFGNPVLFQQQDDQRFLAALLELAELLQLRCG